MSADAAYTLLEGINLLVCKSVGLGDDWDEVDPGVQSAHDFDIQRLERMTGGLDEVDTCVDAVVDNVHAVNLVLGVEVGIEALLDVLSNGTPGFGIVHKISKARSVHDSKSQTDPILLNIGADGLNGYSAWREVKTWLLGLLGGVKRCVEQGIHESRLSETRFTCRGIKSAIF